MTPALAVVALPPRPCDYVLNGELAALARFERGDAFVDIGAQTAQLLKVLQEPTPDPVLRVFWKARNFRHRALKRFDHRSSPKRPTRHPTGTLP